MWVWSHIGAGRSEALVHALEQAANPEATIAPLARRLLDVTQEQKKAGSMPEPSLPELFSTAPRPEFHYVQLLSRILPPTIRVIT